MEINVDSTKLDVVKKQFYGTISDMAQSYEPKAVKPTVIRIQIILSEDSPVYQCPRRLVPKEKADIDKQVDKWLVEGIIWLSCSDYASPILLVPKKDGSLQL